MGEVLRTDVSLLGTSSAQRPKSDHKRSADQFLHLHSDCSNGGIPSNLEVPCVPITGSNVIECIHINKVTMCVCSVFVLKPSEHFNQEKCVMDAIQDGACIVYMSGLGPYEGTSGQWMHC